MIADNIIKQTFITSILLDTVSAASRFSLNIFSKKRKSKTGATFEALTNPKFVFKAGGDNFIIVTTIPIQLRMQDLGVRRLYTRPLWGALKHSYGRLQYGLADEIRKSIAEELQKALNNQ